MKRDHALDQHLIVQDARAGSLPSLERTTRLFAADPFDDRAEPFFLLRDRLFERTAAEADGTPVKLPMEGIVGVLSPDAGDGRSHVAANLAAAIANGGARTLLIDGDLRHPRLHTLLLCTTGPRHLLGRAQEPREEPPHRLDGTHMLSVMSEEPVTPQDGPALGKEPDLRQVLQQCRSRFDCIVVDTPPASQSRDALFIAACCDLVVIVGRKNRTRLADLEKLIHRAERSGARIGGVVVNDH